MHAGALHQSTHRTTGDYTGTRGSRTQQNHASGVLAQDFVHDGTTNHRDVEEVLFSFFYAFGNGGGNFLGLAVADPDGTFTVTDHNQCTEAKVTATLDHLRDTVNRHYTLDVLVIGIVVATVRVTAIIIAAIPATFPTFVLGGFSGFACKFLLFFSHVFLLTGSIRPRGHLRLQPPHGRGTCYHHGRKRQSLFQQPWRARQSACRPAGP